MRQGYRLKKRSFSLSKRQQGMTLLELLVATGILVVVSATAFFSLDNLVNAKAVIDDNNQKINQFNLAHYMFQSDLQMAISARQIKGVNNLDSNAFKADFIGDAQTIILLRYASAAAPTINDQRNNQPQSDQQPIVRVRWFVRNGRWLRATLGAAMPLNSNQWQERDMLAVEAFNCSYQNLQGQMQSSWPGQAVGIDLPEMIVCRIETEGNKDSQLKLVPWQKIGWL